MDGSINICMHVRRGDYYKDRIPTIAYYDKAINLYKNKYPNIKLNFYVFSNGFD
jgi:hypothetical protein